MIGEHEIDVLLLPEMSRAERAGRAKKTNNSHCHALRRRGSAIGRSSTGIVAALPVEGKSLCITPFGLYPASRVSGRGPAARGRRLGEPHWQAFTHTGTNLRGKVCTQYILGPAWQGKKYVPGTSTCRFMLVYIGSMVT
jgi:hypothetical protein